MDGAGPQQQQPNTGRRAGGGGAPLRDWQRNTWYGPSPWSINPFEEPDSAPDLKNDRSENVNGRQGDFWNGQPQGYGYAAPGTGDRTERKPRSEKSVRAVRRAVLISLITILLVTGLVLRFAVFSVASIEVVGNGQIPEAEIIRLSGVRLGDFILTLDEKEVERKITSDYRLQFRYLEREFPRKVILSIREREACCYLTYCGITYVMDKNRMVLAEDESPQQDHSDLVAVKGLDVRSGTRVGQTLTLGNETQQEIFRELFLEMKVQGVTDQILEADLSNTESILLATRDGYTVSLGNHENLHAKIRSMMLVRESLRNMEQTGGAISVINPETPIYTPWAT